MADKLKINDMLDSLLNDKGEEAQVAFHAYAKEKMQDVLHGEKDETSDEPTPTDEDQ